MTDHADTIRAFILQGRDRVFSRGPTSDALTALDALLAERQQAIDALRDAPMPVNVDATPWDEVYADWWSKSRAALEGGE